MANLKEVKFLIGKLEGVEFRRFEESLDNFSQAIKSIKSVIIDKVIEAIEVEDFESIKAYKDLVSLVNDFDTDTSIYKT